MNEIALIVNRYQGVLYHIYLPTFAQLSLHLASDHQLPASTLMNNSSTHWSKQPSTQQKQTKTTMNNTQEPKHPSFVLIGLRLGKRVQPCRPLAFEQMIDDRLSDGARLLRTPCFLLHCPGYSIRGAIRLSIGLTVSVLRCLLPGPSAATELLLVTCCVPID